MSNRRFLMESDKDRVYFLWDHIQYRVKIGYSASDRLCQRIMHICSDEVLLRSLVDLELIGLLKADRFTEKMLHEVFSDLRIKTCAEEGSTEECEWFMETSGLLNYIRELPTLIRPTWEQVFPNGYPGKHHWTHASKPSGRNVQGRGIRIKYPRSAWKPART